MTGAGRSEARRVFLGLGVIVLLIVADQWSKEAVFDWLDPADRSDRPPELVRDAHGHLRVPLAGEWLGFMTVRNPGAAFGRFDDWPYVLVGGRILAVIFLAWLFLRGGVHSVLVESAMVLVLAGALGNLVDNLFTGPREEGHPFGLVRDFVDVWFQPLLGWDYHFPSFNVADSCISVGACLWILSGFFHRSEEEAAPRAEVAVEDGVET